MNIVLKWEIENTRVGSPNKIRRCPIPLSPERPVLAFRVACFPRSLRQGGDFGSVSAKVKIPALSRRKRETRTGHPQTFLIENGCPHPSRVLCWRVGILNFYRPYLTSKPQPL